MSEDATTPRVLTVALADQGIAPVSVKAKVPKRRRQKKQTPEPAGSEGLVEVYNPYSTQMKGKRTRWKSRRRRNAKRDKQVQKRIPKIGQSKTPVRPHGPSDQFTTDPYYESKEWRDLREATLRRDGHRCRYCGAVAHQADHVVPRTQGGTDDLVNLVASCRICNKTAGGRRFTDFSAKRRWVIAHRDETRVEVRERPPTPAKGYPPKPQPVGRLRARLKEKRAQGL